MATNCAAAEALPSCFATFDVRATLMFFEVAFF